MDYLEAGALGLRDQFKDLSSWAFGLEFAVQEGLRYERWWAARLPLEEVRRQCIEEEREKGRRALEWSRKAAVDLCRHAD